MLATNLVGEMVRDRDLQEVPGDAFVTQDRTRVLDRGADVEVPALRVVCRDEEKPARILVVDTWRIHEAAGARWLEGLRELTDLERTEIRGKRNQVVRAQELDHLLLA